jgi:hypothetical protein
MKSGLGFPDQLQFHNRSVSVMIVSLTIADSLKTMVIICHELRPVSIDLSQ